MRVIVLGGTGYLGSRVIKALVESGHEILCLTRPNSSKSGLGDVFEQIEFCPLTQINERLRSKPTYDCMFNAACRYPRNAASDIELFQANFFVPLQIFLECLHSGVQKFVTIATGLPDEFNAYTYSKAKLAETMKWYGEKNRNNHISICNIKLELFYGEDEPKDRFIPGTIEKLKRNERLLLTEGDQLRDFIYIGDVVSAIVKLIKQKNLPKYMDFPLGTGEGVPIWEVIEFCKEIIGSESELCFGALAKRADEPNSIADSEKMRQYGIVPAYHWRDGLKKIINWKDSVWL